MAIETVAVRNARQVGIVAFLINLCLCVAGHLFYAAGRGWCGLDKVFPNLAHLSYQTMTILPMATGIAFLVAGIGFQAHARALGTSLYSLLKNHLTVRRVGAVVAYLLIALPWGHYVKSHSWVSEPWLSFFYCSLLLTLVLAQLVFLLQLLQRKSVDSEDVHGY